MGVILLTRNAPRVEVVATQVRTSLVGRMVDRRMTRMILDQEDREDVRVN